MPRSGFGSATQIACSLESSAHRSVRKQRVRRFAWAAPQLLVPLWTKVRTPTGRSLNRFVQACGHLGFRKTEGADRDNWRGEYALSKHWLPAESLPERIPY